MGPLWCRPGLNRVTITVFFCLTYNNAEHWSTSYVCLSDKKRENLNLHSAPVWLELLFSYKRGRGMRQRQSSRMILLLGVVLRASSWSYRYAQYGYWDKRQYLVLSWFWRLIIGKWCHLLNPRDCSTCFTAVLNLNVEEISKYWDLYYVSRYSLKNTVMLGPARPAVHHHPDTRPQFALQGSGSGSGSWWTAGQFYKVFLLFCPQPTTDPVVTQKPVTPDVSAEPWITSSEFMSSGWLSRVRGIQHVWTLQHLVQVSAGQNMAEQ